MLLAADARNASISVGLSEGDRWVRRFRLSALDRTADEYGFLISAMLESGGIRPDSIDAAALSCVVPSLSRRLQAALKSFLAPDREVLVVGPGVKSGMRIRTDTPGEVGPDLVCESVAAVSRAGAPCVVVSFGAVLTFTAVAAPADLLGVAIAPGLDAAVSAIRTAGALLPQVRLERPERAIGRNTAESVRAGVVLGWSGLVDRIVSAMSDELGGGVSLVGTGEYDAPPVSPQVGFHVWEPYLALDGLRLIAERNDAVRFE